MNNHAASVKETLMSLINEMSESPAPFVQNPDRDFTRNRKLSFKKMLLMLISMGGNSIHKELLDFFSYDINTATSSAFVQQRNKILLYALEFLFHKFTHSFPNTKKFNGHRLLAVDGSTLHIATNPDDSDTYFVNNEGENGYNLLHLNALFDLCGKFYEAAHIQPRRQMNEHRALTSMVDCSDIPDHVIIVADRGYESYNNIAHIEKKGWNYVIRIKNTGGIISKVKLPDSDEFDINVSLHLTRRQTNEIKSQPDKYRFMPSNVNFDYLEQRSKEYYPISFRIVRFKLTVDTYETLITNLDPFAFPVKMLKEVYKKRWGIETSFRELKYAIGLVHFHAKKVEYIMQEVYARMIMYNFSMMITLHVTIQQKDTKYLYQVNFAEAIHICMHFIRCDNVKPPDVEALIQRNILPVRPDRKDIRKMRSKSAVSFMYRVS